VRQCDAQTPPRGDVRSVGRVGPVTVSAAALGALWTSECCGVFLGWFFFFFAFFFFFFFLFCLPSCFTTGSCSEPEKRERILSALVVLNSQKEKECLKLLTKQVQ